MYTPGGPEFIPVNQIYTAPGSYLLRYDEATESRATGTFHISDQDTPAGLERAPDFRQSMDSQLLTLCLNRRSRVIWMCVHFRRLFLERILLV